MEIRCEDRKTRQIEKPNYPRQMQNIARSAGINRLSSRGTAAGLVREWLGAGTKNASCPPAYANQREPERWRHGTIVSGPKDFDLPHPRLASCWAGVLTDDAPSLKVWYNNTRCLESSPQIYTPIPCRTSMVPSIAVGYRFSMELAMAGDWIKMRTLLHEDMKVEQIADLTGLDTFAVIGRLHRLWSWVGENSETGEEVPTTDGRINVRLQCGQFADALRTVGWLAGSEGCMSFPNFTEHNGSSAKRRVQDSARKAENRRSKPANASTSNMSACNADKSGTREEKRRDREEKSKSKSPTRNASGQGTPEQNAAFESWWKSYPIRRKGARRGDKGKARELWDTLGADEHPRIVDATARLVSSDEMPKDAERFLRPPRGGVQPAYESMLDDTNGAIVAGTGKPTAAQQHASDNFEYQAPLISEMG